MSQSQGLPRGRDDSGLIRPDEDDAGAFWPYGVSQAWSDELGDVRQHLYTLADGQPVDAPRLQGQPEDASGQRGAL
jgi:hypothetical protein